MNLLTQRILHCLCFIYYMELETYHVFIIFKEHAVRIALNKSKAVNSLPLLSTFTVENVRIYVKYYFNFNFKFASFPLPFHFFPFFLAIPVCPSPAV